MPSPELLTVTEAAAVLRIGRTTAYELARRDLATGGGERLGVIRIGGQLRIPRAALERLIGSPVTTPATAGDCSRGELPAVSSEPATTPATVSHRTSGSARRRQATSAEQLQLDA